MTRAELDQYLDVDVRVWLFDGDIIFGHLRKTRDERYKGDPNLYLPKDYYFLALDLGSHEYVSSLFRVSHVKKLEPAPFADGTSSKV